MPYSSSASVVVGPIEPINTARNPSRAAASMPCSAATRARWSICTEVVNKAASNSRAASLRAASRSGPVSSGRPHSYTRTRVTSAPRARKPSISSGLVRPYSCTAMRRSGRPAVTARTSCQVFGSPADHQTVQLAGANAGQEHDHVELASNEPLSEPEGFGCLVHGNFAHGWGDERDSALLANQFGHFRRPPAFQRKDLLSREAHKLILDANKITIARARAAGRSEERRVGKEGRR